MTGQEALSIIDRLLEQHQRGSLKTLQAAIVLQVWNRASYQSIGRELGYEAGIYQTSCIAVVAIALKDSWRKSFQRESLCDPPALSHLLGDDELGRSN